VLLFFGGFGFSYRYKNTPSKITRGANVRKSSFIA